MVRLGRRGTEDGDVMNATDYPPEWPLLADAIKAAANWRCIRCDHPHDRESGHVLTVHHMDGNRWNIYWWNLVALCQRCHLHIQGKVNLEDHWIFGHSEWFKVYAAGYYAKKYEARFIPPWEAEERMDELLSLERLA